MSLIPFPDIPNVLGVPALPRSPNFPPILRTGLGIVQGILWRTAQVDTRWGVYDSNGNALGDPATITGFIGGALDSIGIGSMVSTNSVDFFKETRISDFPVEAGGFATYNKVETPASPTVTLCVTGSEANRRSFLIAIDEACASVELYSVVTPEITYQGYSIERYNYQRRSSNGITLLTVEIVLKEIRQVAALYTIASVGDIVSPKNAGATPQVDGGKVQATTPKTSTLKSLSNKFQGLFN